MHPAHHERDDDVLQPRVIRASRERWRQSINVLAKICQARALFATRLSTM